MKFLNNGLCWCKGKIEKIFEDLKKIKMLYALIRIIYTKCYFIPPHGPTFGGLQESGVDFVNHKVENYY